MQEGAEKTRGFTSHFITNYSAKTAAKLFLGYPIFRVTISVGGSALMHDQGGLSGQTVVLLVNDQLGPLPEPPPQDQRRAKCKQTQGKNS